MLLSFFDRKFPIYAEYRGRNEENLPRLSIGPAEENFSSQK